MTVSAESQIDRKRDLVTVAELRNGVKPGLVGFALVLGVVLFLARTFSGIVAPTLLTAWLIAILGIISVFYVGTAAFVVRRPSDEESLRFWTPFSVIVMTLCVIVIGLGNLMFLQAATAELRLLIVVLAMSFVTVLALGSTQATQLMLAVAGNLGTLIFFFLREGGPQSLSICVFLVAFGTTILLMRRFIRAAVIEATKARADSEEAALALEAAVETIAAERDARTRFIRSASHDLQQPIQAAALFLDHALAAHGAEKAAAAAGARTALAATRSLLDNMLGHLRLEAGATPVHLAPLNLGELISTAATAQTPAASAAGMKIIAAPTRLSAIADPELLSRVLSNLIGNAIHHAMGERILIGARRRGADSIEIWVIDDGNGVCATDQDRLFEDFAQGSDHGVGGRGGFGLGLSSVRRMAELMGGTAGLDPRWTGGAAFFVRLPWASSGRRGPIQSPAEAPCEAS